MKEELTLLQLILNGTKGIIWAVDPEYRLIYANNSYREALGLAVGKEVRIGQNVLAEDYTPELKDFWKVNYDRCLLGESVQAESCMMWEDGLHYLENSFNPVRDEEGNIVAIVITSLDITSRKKKEQELIQTRMILEENQTKFQSLFNLSPDPVFIVEKGTGIIREINDKVEKLYGYNREELVGHPNTLVSAEPEQTKKLTESPENYIPIRYHIKKSGETFPIEITVSVLKIQDKEYIIACIRDISEKLKNEEALKKSEEKWRTLFAILPIGVSILDKDSNITESNPALKKILHLEEKEIMDKKYQNRKYINADFTPVSSEDFPSKLAIAQQKTIWSRVIGIVMEEGEIVWTEVNATPTFQQDIGCVIVTSDITERKKLEDELKTIRENLKAIFNATDESIYLISSDFKLLSLNNIAAKRLNSTTKALVGKYIYDLLPKEVAKFRKPFLEEVISRKKPVIFEDERNGRWMKNHLYPVVDGEGGMERVAVFSRDITEQKQASEALQFTTEQLRKTNAEKDKLFSIISHDLRGPIGGIMRLTEMMAFDSRSFTEDERSRFSMALYQSSKKVFDLLEQLLVWSRMERGVINYIPQIHLLKELTTESLELTGELARKKSVELVIDIPDNTEVLADQNMYRTIMRNLVSNALKYSKPGNRIIVSGRPANAGTVIIEVKDYGIGMTPEILAGLFHLSNEFVRPGTEGEPSSGLGLIICKDFAEKHGSKIMVESQEGVGSVFSFVLSSAASNP